MTVTGSAGKLITPHRSGARFILFTGGADVPTSLRDFSGNLDRLAEVVAKETSALQEHATATASTAHAFAPRVVSHWPRGFQTQARGNPRCSVPIACQRWNVFSASVSMMR